MDAGKGVFQVDVGPRLSGMKPIHAHWITRLYDKRKNSDEMIQPVFEVSTITEVWNRDTNFGKEDPFSHLL